MLVKIYRVKSGDARRSGDKQDEIPTVTRWRICSGLRPAPPAPFLVHFTLPHNTPPHSPLPLPLPANCPPYRTTSPRSGPPRPGSSRRGGTAASAPSTCGTPSRIWTRSRCVLRWEADADATADTVQRPARRVQPFPRCHEGIQGPSVSSVVPFQTVAETSQTGLTLPALSTGSPHSSAATHHSSKASTLSFPQATVSSALEAKAMPRGSSLSPHPLEQSAKFRATLQLPSISASEKPAKVSRRPQRRRPLVIAGQGRLRRTLRLQVKVPLRLRFYRR